MKTAILISGVYRPENVKIHVVINELSEAFPDTDVYFHTWDEYKHLVPDYLNVESCPEPILNYDAMLDPNPKDVGYRYNHSRQQLKYYEAGHSNHETNEKLDISNERLELLKKIGHSGTKQILGYADLYEKVQKLNKGYDCFIRTRWDISIQENVDFTPFLRQCEMGPIGISLPTCNYKYYPNFGNHIYDVTKDFHNDQFIFDLFLIHHKDHFDPSLVYELHKDKQLLPSEWGWYQVVVKPYNNKSRSYRGGAGVYRNYERFKEDTKKGRRWKSNEHR